MRDPRIDPRVGDVIRYLSHGFEGTVTVASVSPHFVVAVVADVARDGKPRETGRVFSLPSWQTITRHTEGCTGWTTCDGETVEIREETW